MFSSEEFVDVLLHEDLPLDELHHAYDAAKAREYYLRTRQLKGRKKGSAQPASSSSAAAKAAHAKRLKAATDKRIFELKIRLQKLEDLLDKLSKEAKARSGITDAKSKSGSSTQDRKPLTATQKREAAKKQAERRDDEKKLPEVKALEAKIERAKQRVEAMKVKIAIAQRNSNAKIQTKRALNGR